MEDARLFGKWQSYRSENLENFFERVGASWLKQKIGSKMTSTLVLERLSDSEIRAVASTLCFLEDTVFKVNGIVRWAAGCSECRQAVAAWENGKLVIYASKQSASVEAIKKYPDVIAERQIIANGDLMMTLTHKDVTARRFYRRKG